MPRATVVRLLSSIWLALVYRECSIESSLPRGVHVTAGIFLQTGIHLPNVCTLYRACLFEASIPLADVDLIGVPLISIFFFPHARAELASSHQHASSY